MASSNDLEALPDSIGGCAALASLLVNGNRLITLPAGLAALPRLAKINAASNAIQHLPAEVLDAYEPSLPANVVAAARRVLEMRSSSSGGAGASAGAGVGAAADDDDAEFVDAAAAGGAGAGAGAGAAAAAASVPAAPRKIDFNLESNPLLKMAADMLAEAAGADSERVVKKARSA